MSTDAGHGMVHIGRDGWLFLIGGTNRVLAQYAATPATWWRYRRWRALIEARRRRLSALGIRYVHAIVPEKLTVYGDLHGDLALDVTQSPARRLGEEVARSRAADSWVDLVAPMRAARERAPLYFRTDTHWTLDGCLIGYRALCRACGIAPRTDLAERPYVESPMTRDLGDKLDPPWLELSRSYNYQRDAVRVFVNPLLAAHEAAGRAEELHVGAHVVFRNDGAGVAPLTVMLFGDSCAHFDPIMLTGMLAETVRDLHFVWSPRIDWGYVERLRPDIVIVEMAERFLTRVPKDRFDLGTYGAERLAAFAAS